MGVFSFLRGLLNFYAKDRISLLLFLATSFGLILLLNTAEPVIDAIPNDIRTDVREQIVLIDSLRAHKSQPKRYKFNPNFLSEYNAYVWGLSDSALLRLEQYRAADNWIRSQEEFQSVTGISDSLLAAMEAYFRFPEWTNNTKSSRVSRRTPPKIKNDLNLASAEELQAVYGIGPVLSERIVQFKERYGDFKDSLQLRLIYGLKPTARRELLKYFEVKNPQPIAKFPINEVSASDLSTIPGVSFELAKEIVIFRRLRGSLSSAEELLNLDQISPDRLAGIAVYLQFE